MKDISETLENMEKNEDMKNTQHIIDATEKAQSENKEKQRV